MFRADSDRLSSFKHGDTQVPAPELYVDSSLAVDSLGSFLSIDRSHVFKPLLRDSRATLLDHSVGREVVASAIARMTQFLEI